MCEVNGVYKSFPSSYFYPTIHDAVLGAQEDIFYEEKGKKEDGESVKTEEEEAIKTDESEEEGSVKIDMDM